MKMTDLPGAAQNALRSATGQASAREAIKWIAEGHPLEPGADGRMLLRAIAKLKDAGASRRARERLVRALIQSELDTAAILFSLNEVRQPQGFRRSLDALAWKSPTKTLVGLTPSSVLAAHRIEPSVISTLCAIAGISVSKLGDWADTDVPTADDTEWTLEQIESAWAVIDRIVCGREQTPLKSATRRRALELIFTEDDGGWKTVEAMRRGGVPYEVLLAQREAGGGWLAHRNRTSSRVVNLLAEELCAELNERDIEYLRSSRMGGRVSATEVERLSGASKAVGIIIRDAQSAATAAVAFSVARDGGTARSSGSRLLKLQQARVPVFLVLAGPGWADRNETADLAEAFRGEIYTDKSLGELADRLAGSTKPTDSQ